MKDVPWVGKFVNGGVWSDGVGPSNASVPQALDSAPARAVLYYANGKPLTRPRSVGFGPKREG